MSSIFTRGLAALALALALPLCAFAQGSDSYSENYDLEVHLGGFMSRLYDVLTQPQWLGQHAEVAGTAALLKQEGVFSLDSVQAHCKVEGGKVSMRCAKHFTNLDPQSYLGQIYALPNKPLATIGYVPTDALLYIGANNVPQEVLLTAKQLGSAASELQKQPDNPLSDAFGDADIAQVLGMLDAFNVQQQVDDTLTGEVALALFKAPSVEAMTGNHFGPQDINAALFIGVKDAARIKQLITMAGKNAPLTPMDGNMGGWTGWYVNVPDDPAAGILLSDNVLFITPNVQQAMASIDFSGHAQTTAPCQCYFDLNLTGLQNGLIGPATDALFGMAPADVNAAGTKDAARYLFQLPPADALGHIRATTVFDSGYEAELSMNTALANYLFYYVGVGSSLAAQSANLDKGKHEEPETPQVEPPMAPQHKGKQPAKSGAHKGKAGKGRSGKKK